MNLFDLDAVDSGAAKLYLQKWITRGCTLDFNQVYSGHPQRFKGGPAAQSRAMAISSITTRL